MGFHALIGVCPSHPSLRGQGAAGACEAAGAKKPEAMNEVKLNGVNVTKMSSQSMPSRINRGWRNFSSEPNIWDTGGRNRSIIKEFYGAGQEDSTRTALFVLDADEPPVLLG